MAKLGDLETLKKLKAEQEAAQKELNKARAEANKKKVGSLPKTKKKQAETAKKKQVEAAKKKLDEKKARVKRTKDFIRKNKEASEARKKAKSLAEGKKQFEASKAKAKAKGASVKPSPKPNDSFEKKKRMIEKNRERAPIRERAAKARAANPARVTSSTTQATKLQGPPKPSSSALRKVADREAAKRMASEIAKKGAKRSALRAIPVVGSALTVAELGGAVGSRALEDLEKQRQFARESEEGKRAVREGKRVQPEGGFTGSGNLARQIIENQRRGRSTRIPESEGLQRSEEYIPKYSREELRATDPAPKEDNRSLLDKGLGLLTGDKTDRVEDIEFRPFEALSETVFGDPYELARRARGSIEERAETALEEGNINPEKVGELAVQNEIQKRQESDPGTGEKKGGGTVTQEEATKIKADTEREFKEAGFDGKKAILAMLGLGAMAYAIKEDPDGAINSIASKLDAREQAMLKQEAAAAKQKFDAEQNELDRKNRLDVANARIKGTMEAAKVKASTKDTLKTQTVSAEEALNFVNSWAEDNGVEISPSKAMALARKYSNIISKNPDAVGADPEKVIHQITGTTVDASGKLIPDPRVEKSKQRIAPVTGLSSFNPFSGDYTYR